MMVQDVFSELGDLISLASPVLLYLVFQFSLFLILTTFFFPLKTRSGFDTFLGEFKFSILNPVHF